MPLPIAEVAFNLPLDRSFHYSIPAALSEALKPGMRVAAPFGHRELTGFVVKRVAHSRFPQLKYIRRIIDPVAVIADERWQLAEWLSSYYYCSLGEALAAMVPSAMRLASQAQAVHAAAAAQPAVHKTLTASQQQAFAVIEQVLDAGDGGGILLHGVTGSGKTELYLQAIARVLLRGRSAICLIPEIALTPQTIERFRERFGEQVAVWHSRLTAKQRAGQWWRMHTGLSTVVVGPRSAVFAPLKNIGVIILDEEHETAYKQEDTPHYHAREAAFARAKLSGAAVILGSATPSVESFDAALKKRIRLVELPQRIAGKPLPKVELIDMKEQWGGRLRGGPISNRLGRMLEQAVARNEQVMLLLNRRGFARVAQCQSCGAVERCRHCTIPLIYHAGSRQLRCHYCNAHQALADLCGACRKGYIKLRGSGTERVESELHRLFPQASIARMDSDTTRGRGSHKEIYDAFKTQQIGLLIGTQMIAKGWDVPQVTLAGIISADTALNLPDFRAGERTFDLLTQMAGRAGRGEQPGVVVVQTYCPDHYAIAAAAVHDYRRFYDEEITMRRQANLPPFSRLIELTVYAGSRQRVEEAAGRLAQLLRRQIGRRRIVLLGPAPHRIFRLRNSWRMCLLLKARAVEPMAEVLHACLKSGRKFEGLPVKVDVDPF